ncbi:MAG TPA: serine kinase [Thermoleophilia bacterium]|nr:serine kinase [Thermoleophilia bacterium]
MRLEKLVRALSLRELTPGIVRSDEVTGGYVSDMVSDVLAYSPAGGVLVTAQPHLSMVSVAGLAGLQGVIFAYGRMPEQAVIDRAMDGELCLYSSSADTFEIAGRLYEMGLRGKTDCDTRSRRGASGPPAGRKIPSSAARRIHAEEPHLDLESA